MKKTVFLALSVMLAPVGALAYPNGTPFYLTDTGPFCASCHSAAKAEYMPELPPEAARAELPETKHYSLVRAPLPPSPYIELTKEQKDEVIRIAKLIDSKSSVTLSAPGEVKAGEELTVTVKVRGGNGPAVCLMLVDRALRFQARPVASDGWRIIGEPEVVGQDGKIQKGWLEKRGKGLPRDLNYITIEKQQFDPGRDLFPEGTVTFRLKAPVERGAYTMAAAFLYGTENAETAGFFQRPSGRILFSEELNIRVE
ncbi:MAG: hypothetical protein A2V21_313280 [Deltaproteobacteria bacterium GWC2_55_46]|nr:MAG: hypothetical protein A2Z79_07460 [Deltaproteobacteria bacterium GWA2_55_82]OGQ64753.1 MAG: hypothetical protein A3I81_00250 [Deltaproteobacteria bacterium RIFCSPLOWO2_02_FULL_55_12]OIJ72601.1 MAG: hypothetical protein A2V21_313280 [Deltaproteobacteria bacterium GWC2_55_46]HCY11945.1 hypothetical protein [Deltaproteobacteria bacterium]